MRNKKLWKILERLLNDMMNSKLVYENFYVLEEFILRQMDIKVDGCCVKFYLKSDCMYLKL